jgi:hypothetical protein
MVGANDDDIVSERSAVSYAEAVRIVPNDAYAEACSGAIIAPRVVLTAAHCVVFVPSRTWRVTAPFAMGGPETHTARDGEPMDAAFQNVSRDDYAIRELSDVALLYLDAPFANALGAKLRPRAYAVRKSDAPSWVSSVGRSIGGEGPGLSLSLPTMLDEPASARARIEYQTARITNGKESGGPLFIEDTHELVAVHAHVDPGGKTEAWARVDGDVYIWITQKVSSHGGWIAEEPEGSPR